MHKRSLLIKPKSSIVSRKLLAPEREALILSGLEAGAGTILELCHKLNVSDATVRRDLLSLERQGLVRRVHGGAVKISANADEPFFEQKESSRTNEKNAIAEVALGMINDGDLLYLDGGSTLLALAKILNRRKSLTIVTNSLSAASLLMDSRHSLILTGGRLRPISRTLVGPLTGKLIGGLHFKKAFLGTIGFSIGRGMTTTDPDEAYTKELVIKNSDKVMLLADSSKIGQDSFASSGTALDIDCLITDSGISDSYVRQFSKAGISVVVARNAGGAMENRAIQK